MRSQGLRTKLPAEATAIPGSTVWGPCPALAWAPLRGAGLQAQQGPACVAVLAFSRPPVLWAGHVSGEGCPRWPAALDMGQTAAGPWAPGGTPQGLPWTFPRLTPGPRGPAGHVPGCSRLHVQGTRGQGASATAGGPASGLSETPNADTAGSGPPRASLALRFLLSWAGVDKGATRRCHSGQLEGEGGGSWATRSLEPRSLLGPGLRAQGLQERGPEMGYSESSLSRSESKL